jgi:gliding motility-associated-like protein
MDSTFSKIFSIICFVVLGIGKVWSQTADVTAGCSPLEVNFTAPLGSTTYYWDFKDGVTSNLQNPTSVFTQAGTYNVEFRESISGPIVGTVQIKVLPDPQINISVPPGCAPLNAQFQNTSVIDPGIVVSNYVWVFGDGTSSSGPQNVSHLYPAVGQYDVSFSIETQYPTCDRTVIFTDAVEVLAPPFAYFATTPSPPSSCASSLVVGFVNNSTGVKPLTYAWNLGNGVTSSLAVPPTQTYTAGQYVALLTLGYAGVSGCATSFSQAVTVGSPQAVVIPEEDTVCHLFETKFYTTSVGTYLWNAGPNGTIVGSATDDTVAMIIGGSGTQTISLTVTSLDGLCSTTTNYSVFVDRVIATASSTPSFICSSPGSILFSGNSNQTDVSYLWFFLGGNGTASTQNVNKVFFSPDDALYYGKNDSDTLMTVLIVTSNETGCFDVEGLVNYRWLPNALFMPDVTKGCFPLSVTMSDSSTTSPTNPIVKREWLFGDGTSLIVNNALPVTHVYTSPGEYLARLVVTTQSGCVDTSYAVLIEVGSDLTTQLNFVADKTAVCPGELVTFDAQVSPAAALLIDAYHFESEGHRVFHCADQTTVPWAYHNLAGPQDVSLTVDYNGCFSTVTKTAFVNVKGAIAQLDFAGSCETPMEYVFKNKSLSATNVTWDFGDAQSSTSLSAITHTYAGRGDYRVILTASDPASGCAATKDTAMVYTRQIKARITTDTLWCAGIKYYPNGSASTDVESTCYKGYGWQVLGADVRPLTSSNPFPPTGIQVDTGGTYTLQLIVSDINGCRDTTTKTLKVFELESDWSADKIKICAPNTVQFTDLSVSDTTIVDWNWTFGDLSSTSSSIQSPAITLSAAPASGTSYDVRLIVKDKLGCRDTLNAPLAYYKPSSYIITSGNGLCLGDSITISAPDYTDGGSTLSFYWEFGNGQTSTSAVNKILYATPQAYSIFLRYTEVASGCKDSTNLSVGVEDYPQAEFFTNVDSLAVLCAPQNVFFQDSTISSSPVTYAWDYGNGQTSTGTSFALFYPKGTYTASLIVRTANGCADTTEQVFKVFRPEGDYTIDKNTICKGEEITFNLIDTTDVSTYTWAFGDGTTLDDIAPVTHKYNFHPVSGQTPSRLILKGVNGICPVEVQKMITIRQVIADFDRGISGDTSLCFNDGPYPFINTSTSADTYQWDFGDLTFSNAQNPVHQYASAGQYDVTLSISNTATGCVDTIVKKAVIYNNPVTTPITDTVCLGSTIQLGVLNPVVTNQYEWTPSTGLSNPNIFNPIATLNRTVVYNLVETDTNGCQDAVTVPAVVFEPIVLRDLDTSIVIGDRVTLPVNTPSAGYIFTWTPTEGLSCLDCNYPVIQPLKDIAYTLNVKDIKGCFSNDYLFEIVVLPETTIKMPTAFTPNGDGVNDVVYVQGWGIKELLEFTIFNRWGQQIYASNDIKEGWNGKFNGVLQNSDVYIYKVKVKTWRDEELKEEGHINLLH